jgi:hypothetical protein
MSTNLSQLSELNTVKSIDFCPVATLPVPTASAPRSHRRFQDLGIVIERLFTFYEAMRTGKPVADGEDMLAQVGGALSRSTRIRNHA